MGKSRLPENKYESGYLIGQRDAKRFARPVVHENDRDEWSEGYLAGWRAEKEDQFWSKVG